MKFTSANNQVDYYSFESFSEQGVLTAVFPRRGGVSPAPWNSLNLGGTVGDERAHVIENRRRIFEAVNRPVESLFDVWQVHSVDAVKVDAPRPLDVLQQKADIILTEKPEITLFMRFADCTPVFLFDPEKKAIALIHAGWEGTVKQASAVAVRKMVEIYHSRPEALIAGIGPSIGPDHYEVGENVIRRVKESFGPASEDLLEDHNGHVHFNLWKANQVSLQMEGVRKIEIAGICTACHVDDWYSHRAEKGRTGRFGALMALEDKSYGGNKNG